jgi:hypothetical protein
MQFAITPEIIIGIFTLTGGIVLALNKIGLINFGKSASERRSCPSQVIGTVKGLCDDHKSVLDSILAHEKGSHRREEKIDLLTESINKIECSVNNIEGYLQGRNGYHPK